jgi:hypothetical protein
MTIMLTFAASALLSCGATKSGSGATSLDFASRIDDTAVVSSDKPLAYCNRAENDKMTIDLNAYIDDLNKVHTDMTLLKLKKIDVSFVNNPYYIQFFRWKASSKGSTYLDEDPLEFRVYDASGSFSDVYRNYLDWSYLKSSIQHLGFSGTDLNALISKVVFLVNLNDPRGDYDAIKAVIYEEDKSGNGSVISQQDMLIPVFYANPADYATDRDGTARPDVLKTIHPFANMASEGWTVDSYATESFKACFSEKIPE